MFVLLYNFYWILGDCWTASTKVKAIDDYNKVIELNPNDATAYHDRGLAYKRKGKHDKAIQDFNKTIEIKDFAEAYYTRGECYRQRNDFSNCANDFFISAFLLFMQKRGNEALKLIKATYDLKDITDSPVCFECGLPLWHLLK